MKINGKNYCKAEVLSILTEEGKKAVKNGVVTIEEVATDFRLAKVQELAQLDGDVFRLNYNRIPSDILTSASFEQLAELVKAFYKAYSDGKNGR